jgi:CRISPR-associated protein Cmr2
MSTNERFRRKLAAFLHDPIDKPLVLMQTGERHEERARRLRERFGLAELRPAPPASDHVASAMERAFVPEQNADGGRVTVDFRDAPEIRHPFSGTPLAGTEALADLDLEAAQAGVEAAVETFDLSVDAPDTAFFSLWRTLLPALRQEGPDALAPYWSVLPADTRIPDHSLFQHLTATSAFSGLERSEGGGLYTDATLLLVTIGPAQAFIQQARKTQDLYWGSALLSHLAWAAMTPVVAQHGPDAVFFPDLYGQPLVDAWLQNECGVDLRGAGRADETDVPTLPNRFFAVAEAADEDARASLLESVETAVYDRLDAVADAVLNSAVIPSDERPHREAVLAHLRDALSVYGVAVPVQPGDEALTAEGMVAATEPYVDDETLGAIRQLLSVADGPHTRYDASPGHVYSLLHTLTEKMLAAQKNTRAFAPLPANEDGAGRVHGERGRKCSLCGKRNVLFYRGAPAQIQHNTRAICVDDAPGLDTAQMRDGEGLCGVCFVKRFVGRTDLLDRPDGGFPSTTDVALAPLLDRHQHTFEQVENGLRQGIGSAGTFDAQLYFEENLRPGYLAKHVFPDRDDQEDQKWLAERGDALRRVLDEKLGRGLRAQMTKYYGLLVLDGDNLGDWLAGAEAPPFEDIYHSDVWDQLPDALKEKLRSLPALSGNAWGKRPLTPALHAAFSRALTDYALGAVRPIVEEEHHGTLVYAGGDDMLAFVPLAEALDVALHLRAAFSGHREWPETDSGAVAGNPPAIRFQDETSGFRRQEGRIVTTLGPDATASVGLALAHYKIPLGEVLRAAYGMEKRAKEADDMKDKLAVALLKRSGERTEGLIPFRALSVQEQRGPVGVFQDLVRTLDDPALDLSPRFIRTLQQELRPLLTDEGRLGGSFTSEDAETLVESEIARLLRRALDADDPGRAEAFVDEMAGRLANACKAAGSVRRFLNLLDVALFLHRKTNAADVRRAHAA